MSRSMLVKDHMVTEVVTLHPDMEILRAAQVLIGSDISGAPVLDQHGRLVGMLGLAVAHRENTVRGRPIEESGGLFNAGYELTGPVLGIGIGTEMDVTGMLQLVLEARLVHTWIQVDVADGRDVAEQKLPQRVRSQHPTW